MAARRVDRLDDIATQVLRLLVQQKTDAEVAEELNLAENDIPALRTRGFEVLVSGVARQSSNFAVGLELLSLDIQAKEVWATLQTIPTANPTATDRAEYRNLHALLVKITEAQHKIRMDAGLIVKRRESALVHGVDPETADLGQLSEVAEVLVEDVQRLLPKVAG